MITPNRATPFDYAEIWNKASDYLYEISIYERAMAESLFHRDYETCLRAADLILMKISFLMKDTDGRAAHKVLARGIESKRFKDIRAKITVGMKYACASKMGLRNKEYLAYQAFNISREVFLELTNAIYECELYFKKGGNPGTAVSRGLSGQ